MNNAAYLSLLIVALQVKAVCAMTIETGVKIILLFLDKKTHLITFGILFCI